MSFYAEKIDDKFQKSPESFNDQFFKNCICYTLLFKTTDKIVHKSDWYISETYTKPGVVAYTISKLIYSIPKEYCLDYNTIWRKQELYPSLIAELGRLAHETFNYVQGLSGNGMEHFKKEETWEKYKNINFQLSDAFLKDLIKKELIESQSRSETKEKKETKKINIEIEIVNLGGKYWENLINQGLERRLLSSTELDLLKLASKIETSGKIPSPKQAQYIWKIRQKLEDAGVLV